MVKNYARFGRDKKVLMGKLVSEAFKEVHGKEWKRENPNSGDIVLTLLDRYRTPARWEKAVQHMRDEGKLEGSPKDIGPLLRAVVEDIQKECEDDIKQIVWAWAWSKMKHGLGAGLPEWYKQRLLNEQFSHHDGPPTSDAVPDV